MRSDNYTGLRCMLTARLRKPTPLFCLSLKVTVSFVNLVYSNLNLNSIFNTSNVIMTKYRFFAQQKHLSLEIEACDFPKIILGFWPLEPHFVIKKRVGGEEGLE